EMGHCVPPLERNVVIAACTAGKSVKSGRGVPAIWPHEQQRLSIHNNEANDTHSFMDLEGVQDVKASRNLHNRKAQTTIHPHHKKPKNEKPYKYFPRWRPRGDDE